METKNMSDKSTNILGTVVKLGFVITTLGLLGYAFFFGFGEDVTTDIQPQIEPVEEVLSEVDQPQVIQPPPPTKASINTIDMQLNSQKNGHNLNVHVNIDGTFHHWNIVYGVSSTLEYLIADLESNNAIRSDRDGSQDIFIDDLELHANNLVLFPGAYSVCIAAMNSVNLILDYVCDNTAFTIEPPLITIEFLKQNTDYGIVYLLNVDIVGGYTQWQLQVNENEPQSFPFQITQTACDNNIVLDLPINCNNPNIILFGADNPDNIIHALENGVVPIVLNYQIMEIKAGNYEFCVQALDSKLRTTEEKCLISEINV